ncbi:hypothetical protein LEP1GSC021_0477 [Leptospira noguchii str. 1993005606]|nr:hypothetical protein LEP1GSC021_0477 [Leptospira noguchii str. 1993005606]
MTINKITSIYPFHKTKTDGEFIFQQLYSIYLNNINFILQSISNKADFSGLILERVLKV